jgi:hypothetical protein
MRSFRISSFTVIQRKGNDVSLYVVIYSLNQVGGSIGPLPYDMNECQERAAAIYESLDANKAAEDGITRKDVRLACEFREVRPENTFKGSLKHG